jgi:NAD(P)H-dependent flavin oxidoreductase YrpB (nitropropane dioxygenase family)
MRDMKLKPLVELFTPSVMNDYAGLCGWALAGAHARSGDAAKIAGYLGKKEDFDEALADFSESYADQNEKDYKALVKAVQQGRLEVYLER